MELAIHNQTKLIVVGMISPTCRVDSVGPKERIWLEVGHAYEPRRWASGRAVPEDWRVWVRGVAGADISALVDKVVFHLYPDRPFPFPKRICLDPPYQLEETGSAPKYIFIDVHFKCSTTTTPEILQLRYDSLHAEPDKSSAHSKSIFHDFQNPSDEIRMGLLKSASAQCSGSKLVVLPDSRKVQSQTKQTAKTEPLTPVLHKQILTLRGSSFRGKKRIREFSEKKIPQKQLKMSQKTEGNYEFVAPIDVSSWENMNLPDAAKAETSNPVVTQLRKTTAPNPSECFSFGNARAELKNVFRHEHSTVKLTEGELDDLSRMCAAQGIYGKSVKALQLPPWSDPLYRLPELPASLRRALDDEPDHVLQ